MTLSLATLLPGLFLTALGLLLVLNLPVVISTLRGLPRSPAATLLLFGGGMLWFLARVATMSEADRIFGSSNVPWVIGFAAIGVLSFKYAPDFLAVRGLCVLILLAAMPLLQAAFMEYDHPQRLLLVTLVYAAIATAIYLAAAPYRLRDFFQWLFASPARARAAGGALLVLGILLNVVAFTY
ncbi:MAG: hypothetical protein A3G75_10360 [Verrucomicrobia bacterium RIFCSPLOWO2_12_FULL_64_8]|nr:MAG: hypothetical protein A3G75_10360 [Verrucomicrobia bacterium RIFCSPLOWO2_12_FULL_64_8]